jgi:hypothetical protein
MSHDAASWKRQREVWSALNALHASAIDLERIELIRGATRDQLADPAWLEKLLLELGLNDEAVAEFPDELRARCGGGLRIWQYPTQLSKYLVELSRRNVRSYLEIGIRHGGSFVATAEYLERFHPLEFAVGIDIIPCPSMTAYRDRNPKAAFWCINTRAAEFASRLDVLGPIDLVFVDSHHEEEQCRAELRLLEDRASMIAFHDIVNVGCPGIARVWQELRQSSRYTCFEYVEQYGELGPFMGIGLAIKKGRVS